MSASVIDPHGRFTRLWRWLTASHSPELPRHPEFTTADRVLAPLIEQADDEQSRLIAISRTVRIGTQAHRLPKFVLPGGSDTPEATRVGIFGGIDARSLDTVLAVARVLHCCEQEPSFARDFVLGAYPKTNVEAFASSARSQEDFQRRTTQRPGDDDGRFFRNEIKTWGFSMMIRLRSEPDSKHFHARVRGELIARTVVAPALYSMSDRMPFTQDSIELLPRHRSARLAARGNCLSPANSHAGAIEIELHAGGDMSTEERAAALASIVLSILANYRRLLNFRAML